MYAFSVTRLSNRPIFAQLAMLKETSVKVIAAIARYLLGIMFLVFGLNGFLHFIHQPPPPSPLAVQFFMAVSASHFMTLVFAVQIVGAVLLLSGRFIPLALTILAPVVINILNYHFTMDPSGVVPGLVAAVFWFLVFIPIRSSFSALLLPRSSPAV